MSFLVTASPPMLDIGGLISLQVFRFELSLLTGDDDPQ